MEATNPIMLEATLLGTGTSTGVPVIGCDCRVCTSTDPHDKRYRCACHIKIGDISIQIDVGPDFRTQALIHQILDVDAVLITHHHFDHIAGLDDLRPYFYQNQNAISCFANADTAEKLLVLYPYIFVDASYPGVSNLTLSAIDASFTVNSRNQLIKQTVEVTPIPVFHGKLPMLGFRIGRFAYLTDTSSIPEESYDKLHGLDVLILDALRNEEHATHFSIPEAIEAAKRIGAKETWFIHMTHHILHAETNQSLPENIKLAHDGLVVTARYE